MTQNRALFDCDADGQDAGFVATFGETLSVTLRAPTGITSWILQVWNPSGFSYGIPILDNAPRASKNAPLLNLTGTTTGQSVNGQPSAQITAPIPASGINSWIFRSVVNGGMSGTPAKPDASLIWERLVVTTSSFPLRKPPVTELAQYEPDAWAGVICDLVDAVVGSGGGGGGLIVGGTPLSGFTPTSNGTSAVWSLGPGFFVVGTHVLRDGLPSYQTPLGTLVLTRNDGLVWVVSSVGPVAYSLYQGPGYAAITPSDVVAPTTLLSAPPAGLFTAGAYLTIKTAGSQGKLIGNVLFTDPSGVAQVAALTAPIDIATVGNAGGGSIPIVPNGSTDVQYSVTAAAGTYTKGSLAYDFRVSVKP
jgi:hypothetical protein